MSKKNDLRARKKEHLATLAEEREREAKAVKKKVKTSMKTSMMERVKKGVRTRVSDDSRMEEPKAKERSRKPSPRLKKILDRKRKRERAETKLREAIFMAE